MLMKEINWKDSSLFHYHIFNLPNIKENEVKHTICLLSFVFPWGGSLMKARDGI
jgi:hypothetical protein